jgi:formate hydrogenlyase transcriptional activator
MGEIKLEGRPAASPSSTFVDTEREQILRILCETRWVIGGPVGAAAKLGLKRTTLSSKMKKLSLTQPQG